MPNQANIKAVITAEDRASKTLKGVADNTKKSSLVMSAAIAGVSLALGKFLKDSLTAFKESQDAITQTNAVLKSTGGIAGVTADQVDQLSKSLQKTTRFSDEAVREAENLLLTFTKVGKDIFPQATETILDMSTALGQDTKSSAIQLGKALQDPILGVTALRRVGVNFSAAQRDVIENLVKTGREAEAQALILKELQTEFGGSAKAAGETFGGQVDKLKNQLNDLQEQIGGLLVKYLQPMVEWLLENEAAVKALLIALGILATAAVFATIAKVFMTTFAAAKAAVVGTTTAVHVLHAAVASPMILPALAIGAAIASIALVYKSWLDTKRAIQNSMNSLNHRVRSDMEVNAKLLRLVDTGTAEQRARALKTANSLGLNLSSAAGLPKFAEGTNFAPGGMALVGEQGAELVNLPRGSQVIPNDKTRDMLGSNTTVNLNVNVGMYAGTDIEKRKIAKALYQSLQEAMGTNFRMAS